MWGVQRKGLKRGVGSWKGTKGREVGRGMY